MSVASKYISGGTPTNSVATKYTSTNSRPGIASKYISGGGELDVAALAEQAGIELNKKPKLSFLRRLGAGLGAFETGNAVSTGIEEGVGAGVKTYLKDVGKGLASAVTGRDYGQTEKKSYRDIIQKMGVTNGIAKFGLGLAGDILLDPSTYFGGFVAKQATKGVKLGTEAALKTVGKAAPQTEQGLRLAGKGVKDALGKAFKFGYGTSKGLPEKALETASDIDKAKVGIVMSNIRRLGTDTLSPSQQEELALKLLEGKRAEFALKGPVFGTRNYAAKQAGRAAAKSSDPLVQEAINKQITRSQKFAKSAAIDDPYAVYFPGLAKDKLTKFFQSTRSFKVGSEGYRKEFKNLLKDQELILNPAEAFAKTEFQIAKDGIVRSQLKSMVNEFGKPLSAFKTEDEAIKAGYRAVKEKGAFGKVVGYLLENDKDFIDNLISPEFTTIDAIAKHTGYDAITSFFKRSVTGLFAPFHVRNYVSGLVQNYEVLGPKALSPVNIATGQRIAFHLARSKKFGSETLELAGHSYKLDHILEAFSRRFETSSQYIADIGDATANASKLTKVKSLNPLSEKAIHFRAARAVGNFIETQQKATAYITALRNGNSVKQALDLAAQAGFDYRAVTPFESKILRRIIPFYTFTRKNIELQLRTLGENPQRINQIFNLLENTSNLTDEERASLPDYLQQGFPIKFGEKNGEPVVSPGFDTAVESFGKLFGTNPLMRLGSMLNPVLKIPLERAVDKDFYRQLDLSKVLTADEYAKAPEFIKDFLDIRQVTKRNGATKYEADPYKLHLLRNLPTSRGVSYLDAIFDDSEPAVKALQLGTGLKPKPIDIETTEYFREEDKQKELEELLIRAGLLKEFTRVYKPKNVISN